MDVGPILPSSGLALPAAVLADPVSDLPSDLASGSSKLEDDAVTATEAAAFLAWPHYSGSESTGMLLRISRWLPPFHRRRELHGSCWLNTTELGDQ